jgi:hypothetical protein
MNNFFENVVSGKRALPDEIGRREGGASPRNAPKIAKILLGMTADVLPLMPKFKHEQIST